MISYILSRRYNHTVWFHSPWSSIKSLKGQVKPWWNQLKPVWTGSSSGSFLFPRLNMMVSCIIYSYQSTCSLFYVFFPFDLHYFIAATQQLEPTYVDFVNLNRRTYSANIQEIYRVSETMIINYFDDSLYLAGDNLTCSLWESQTQLFRKWEKSKKLIMAWCPGVSFSNHLRPWFDASFRRDAFRSFHAKETLLGI